MPIVSRAGWGAVPPKRPLPVVAPSRRRYFVVHHSGGPADQTVRAIQHWCMEGRGFSDIDYNWLVGQDGTIYEGRGWNTIGAHTTNFNTTGVGVCIIGTDEISDAAKTSVRWLYDEYTRRCGRALAVKGHRDLATTGTVCPGGRVYAWLKAGMPAEVRGGTLSASADAVVEAMESERGQAAIVKALKSWVEVNPEGDPEKEKAHPTFRVGGAIRMSERRAKVRHQQILEALARLAK